MYTNNIFVGDFVYKIESFPRLSVKYDVKEGCFFFILQRFLRENLEITAF